MPTSSRTTSSAAARSAYNRNTSDTRIDYIPNQSTSIFGKYGIEPFSVTDPQELQNAGGGTFDGGQPGAASGRIQNVGLGVSHVFSPNLVARLGLRLYAPGTGAQSTVDLAAGYFGLDTLDIPGTNGVGTNYIGQPTFAFGTVANNGTSTAFSSLGNANGANPFLFRDNQFTGDVNLSWTKGTPCDEVWLHLLPLRPEPFSADQWRRRQQPARRLPVPGRDDQLIQPLGITVYNTLADMLLGLPNNGTGIAVAKETQLHNPNALRWTEICPLRAGSMERDSQADRYLRSPL